jgi:hypothetical protein
MQRRGVGRALLQELLPADPRTIRSTAVESFQAVAQALYAGVGMVPRADKVSLVGESVTSDSPSIRLSRSELTTADLGAIDALDERILGFRRPDDHRWWMRSMTGLAYRDGGVIVGYAYVDDDYVAPALADDESTLAAIFIDAAAMAHSLTVRTHTWRASGTLFRTLIAAGFRVVPSRYSIVYASSAGPLPDGYISHADWLP